MSKHLLSVLVSCFLVAQLYAQVPQSTVADDFNSIFKTVKWRSIGPFRGGRSVAGCGVVGDPKTYYMGTTGGGLWKTDDLGLTWRNVSDGYFKTGSVGAVAVAESDPNVVYVGMGEHAVRGVMTHHGDGVYKSTDAGKTWKRIGLELTQHISRIIIDPKNPNVVLVAAQGALYSHSPQRGVYKSIDGGVSWKNVLFVDDKTGAAELSMDMTNTRILYAAMWEHGRLPWKDRVGLSDDIANQRVDPARVARAEPLDNHGRDLGGGDQLGADRVVQVVVDVGDTVRDLDDLALQRRRATGRCRR